VAKRLGLIVIGWTTKLTTKEFSDPSPIGFFSHVTRMFVQAHIASQTVVKEGEIRVSLLEEFVQTGKYNGLFSSSLRLTPSNLKAVNMKTCDDFWTHVSN